MTKNNEMLFGKSSQAEKDAAYNVVHAKILVIIDQWVPYLFKGQAKAELESPRGHKAILETIDAALEAADAVRNKPTQ